MDQLKVALAVLKKHHFWVLCGVVIVLAMAIWVFASQGLAKQFDERKSTIEGKKQAAESINSEPPNQDTIDKMSALTGRLKEHVLSAWEAQYDLQKQNNPWPALLGREFLDYVELLKPDEEIPQDLREIYWNFIQENLPMLVDIVDIYLPVELDENGEMVMENGKPKKVNPFESRAAASASYGSGGFGMEGAEMGEGSGGYGMGESGGAGTRNAKDKHVGKVKWSQAALSGIRKHLNFPSLPTSGEVRLAQESLWVYAALLRIIDQTNTGASAHYNASVKQIERLDIGRDAAQAFMQSAQTLIGTGTAGGGGYGMEGGMEGMGAGGLEEMGSMGMSVGMGGYEQEMGGGYSMEGGGTGTGTESGSRDEARLATLTRGRYVDLKGKPLMDASQQPFAEFKMMPVRMWLVVDQRKLPDLLANCANASMPVSVRRVRIEPGAARKVQGGGGMSGMGSGGGGYSGMQTMGMGGGGSAGMGMGYEDGGYEQEGSYGTGGYGAGGSNRMKATSSVDIPIEVQGIIFIFNPPDRTKLGTGTAGQEPEAVLPVAVPAPAAAPSGPPTPPPTATGPTAPPDGPPSGAAPGTGPGVPAPGAGVSPPSAAPGPGGTGTGAPPGAGAPAAGGVTPAPAGPPGAAAAPGSGVPPNGTAPGVGTPPAGTVPAGGPAPAAAPPGVSPTGAAPAGGTAPPPAGAGGPGAGA